MPHYLIQCRVILSGATMFVEADSIEEAKRKAEKSEWYEIEYAQAELIDWETTGEPVENK